MSSITLPQESKPILLGNDSAAVDTKQRFFVKDTIRNGKNLSGIEFAVLYDEQLKLVIYQYLDVVYSNIKRFEKIRDSLHEPERSAAEKELQKLFTIIKTRYTVDKSGRIVLFDEIYDALIEKKVYLQGRSDSFAVAAEPNILLQR